MRRLIFSSCVACLALAFMAACHRDGLSEDQRAVRAAASEIVEDFIDGRYEEIVANIPDAEAFSDSYRQQLTELMAEHYSHEREVHGGVAEYAVTGDTICGDEAQVFVVINFADSTSEEISIPLQRDREVWKLR